MIAQETEKDHIDITDISEFHVYAPYPSAECDEHSWIGILTNQVTKTREVLG